MKSLQLIIPLIAMIGLIACQADHDTEALYLDRAHARASGEFDRGWLPDFIPTSAKNIHLAYDLSPSREWCAFDFDPADAVQFLQSLTAVDHDLPTKMNVPRAGEEWWPKILEGDLEITRIRDAGMRLYAVKRPLSQRQWETMLFAIDEHKGRAYFYGH